MCPLLVVGGYALGQWCHAVFAVPAWQTVEPLVQRVVGCDVLRVDKAADVLVPALDALLQGSHGDAIACLLCQVLIGESDTCATTVFCHASHHVLAEVVVLREEGVDLHRQ